MDISLTMKSRFKTPEELEKDYKEAIVARDCGYIRKDWTGVRLFDPECTKCLGEFSYTNICCEEGAKRKDGDTE